jgi:hypothetical protein
VKLRSHKTVLLMVLGTAILVGAWKLARSRMRHRYKLDLGVTLADVTNSYISHLEKYHPAHAKKFIDRLSADTDAAQAEAVVFFFLKWLGTSPTVAEDVSSGGPDFRCAPSKGLHFYVEVSSIDPNATARHSHWGQSDHRGAFSLATAQLRGKVTGKAVQLSGLPDATVLVLTSSHIGALALMGRHAAMNLMVSDYSISYSLGDDPSKFRYVTDLKRSVFFRPDKRTGEIVACRRSVSAILLLSVSDLMTGAIGLLHPDPEIALPHDALGPVPMLCVTNWLERASGIRTAWSRRDSEHLYYHYERTEYPPG